MRDLAVRLRNKEETKRLVIEIQGNNINYPKWWPQQQTHKVIKPCCILPFSHKPQPKQQRVDARILSISTGMLFFDKTKLLPKIISLRSLSSFSEAQGFLHSNSNSVEFLAF